MEIQRFGGTCIAITTNKDKIIVDPKLHHLGLKDRDAHTAVQLLTSSDLGVEGGRVVVEGPGEYEVNDISIRGIAARAHTGSKGDPLRNTIYRVDNGNISVALIGNIYPELSERQLEGLGVVDVVIIPVGGHGYTLDAVGAVQVIRKIEPKIVIPVHYAEANMHYPMPQEELEAFNSEIGVAPQQINKLKFKSNEIPENLVVYELARG